MKGLNLFLAACFAVPTFDGAIASVAKNTTRAQSTNARTAQTTNTSVRNTGNTKSRNAQSNTVSARNTTNKNIVSRTHGTTSRSALPSRNTTTNTYTTKKNHISSRSATSATRPSRTGVSRSATTTTRESVMQRDFSKCKDVFFECMDEFCANKDTQLKRCACSARANDFTKTQQSLDNATDKLSDFSQRLLHVNMDPADAAVINTATDGENAYYATKDTSSSKKTLDTIAEKLNTSFDSANNNMSAISWSLDIDSAFDTIDSTGGISTSTKSGTDLLNAALPICREMATEVCSSDDISLVETSYDMVIEQDCNTVQKSFETQTQQVRTQILDSGALLDMTRLNKYQSDNSDDILTCKSKMLDMLTNTNVCGENLTKCLDISGRYINPTTGEVFLSTDLIGLTTLITRPNSSDTWAGTPNNSSFVSYLNNKKEYIEPATQNCQTIADDVWDDFLEDALSQIKLAQNAKIEEVRQSCTTLLSECLENANTSLQEFDSRALSTFGVLTDKTANALCENVRTSCNSIMNYNVDDTAVTTTVASSWETGVNEITTNETYTTILDTCREIGQNCIINSCTSINGNFGLCQDINESVNRHSILTRAACWDDVYNCVSQAGAESIANIHDILSQTYGTDIQDFYEQTYTTSLNSYTSSNSNTDRVVYDICTDKYNSNQTAYDTCRITEQIWGNCKSQPNSVQNNPILIPNDYPETTTLLAWFAKNTYTDSELNSCSTSICPAGTLDYTIGTSTMCVAPSNVVSCDSDIILCRKTFLNPNNKTNCCPSELSDSAGNCCMNGNVTDTINFLWSGMLETSGSVPMTTSTKVCTPNSDTTTMTLITKYTDTNNTIHYIFCSGNVVGGTNNTINCDGTYLELIKISDTTNTYTNYYYATITPDANNNASYNYSVNYFINADKSSTTAYCNTTNIITGSNTWPNPNNYTKPGGKWFINLQN